MTTEYNTYIHNSGGLVPLSQLFDDNAAKIRSMAIQIICTITIKCSDSRDTMRNIGTIPRIMKLLHDSDCNIRSYATNSLRLLTTKNVQNCNYICREGLLPSLASIAVEGDGITRDSATKTLWTISQSSPDNFDEIRRVCNENTCVKLLRAPGADNRSMGVLITQKVMFGRDVLGKSCGVYAALHAEELINAGLSVHDINDSCTHHNTEFAESFINGNVIPVLVRQMSIISMKGMVQCAAAEILCSIVVHNSSTCQNMFDAGIMPLLLNMLQSVHLHVRKCTAMVIYVISCSIGIDDGVNAFCEIDFLNAVADLLNVNDKDILSFAMHFLRNMSFSNATRLVLSNTGVMANMIRICKSADDITTLVALRLLHCACSGSRKNLSQLCDLHGVPMLVTKLGHSIPSIRLTVLNVMVMLTDSTVKKKEGDTHHVQQLKLFTPNSSHSTLCEIGIPVLENMLDSDVEDIRKSALAVLLNITQLDPDALQNPKSITNLVTLLGDNKTDIRIMAASILRSLMYRYNGSSEVAEKLLEMLDDECSTARTTSISLFRCMAKKNEIPIFNILGSLRLKHLLSDINALVRMKTLGLILDFSTHRQILAVLCDAGVMTMVMAMVENTAIEIQQTATNVIRRASGYIGACGAECGVEIVLDILRRGGNTTQSYAIAALQEMVQQGEDTCMSICEAGGVPILLDMIKKFKAAL